MTSKGKLRPAWYGQSHAEADRPPCGWELRGIEQRAWVSLLAGGLLSVMLLSAHQGAWPTSRARVESQKEPAPTLATGHAAQSTASGLVIDLNQADVAELTLLPGVGVTLAGRIVESRRTSGPFTEVSQLQRVYGIGPKTVASLRRWVRVETEPKP